MTAQVRCVDGRVLGLVPVPVLDRRDEPYEATLRLVLDERAWGEVGVRCAGLLTAVRHRDLAPGEVFDLRAQDPDDVTSRGELRARVDVARAWSGAGWTARTDVVLQAWGDDGTGVRAVLTPQAFHGLLDALLVACAAAGALDVT